MTAEEKKKLLEAKEILLEIYLILTDGEKIEESNPEAFSLLDLIGVADALRLHSKYRVFDLEATQRENKYLQKLLKESDK